VRARVEKCGSGGNYWSGDVWKESFFCSSEGPGREVWFRRKSLLCRRVERILFCFSEVQGREVWFRRKSLVWRRVERILFCSSEGPGKLVWLGRKSLVWSTFGKNPVLFL
jgi:hypothetical protein